MQFQLAEVARKQGDLDEVEKRLIRAVELRPDSEAYQGAAAKFFKDPHMAQEVRQSDRARDEELWRRYKAFGRQAAATCNG